MSRWAKKNVVVYADVCKVRRLFDLLRKLGVCDQMTWYRAVAARANR